MLAEVIPAGKPGDPDPGFGPRIAYICRKACRIEMRHLAGGWIHAGDQMRWIARLNPHRSRPCHHLVLSWSPLEQPDDDQMIAAARQVLRALGAGEHQAVIAIHRDRAHPHAHIILNVIHPLTGKGLDLGHDYARLEKACRRIERQMGWPADRGRYDVEIVADEIMLRRKPAGHWQQCRRDREEGFRSESTAMRGHALRTGLRPLHRIHGPDQLRLIRRALDACADWPGTHDVMRAAGWDYRPHGSGARISSRQDPTWSIPASHLGARFSLRRMVKRLGAFIPAVKGRVSQATSIFRRQLQQIGNKERGGPLPQPDPEILEPLAMEQADRRRQAQVKRQAREDLRARQAEERRQIGHCLGRRRNGVAVLIRSMMHQQQRDQRQWLQASHPRRGPLPLAGDMLASHDPDSRLSRQYLRAMRLHAQEERAIGITPPWDHTACRQEWALAERTDGRPVSPPRLDHLLAVFRNDLRIVTPSTILIAQRDLRDGISGFCRIDPDRGIFDSLPAPGGRAGLIRIGPRGSRTCRLVPDLQTAMITALMTVTEPALIALMPDDPDPEQEATCTTPHGAHKATPAFTHTCVSRRFSELLGTLAHAIEAECDVQHGWSRDPAFAHWLRESELLWQQAQDMARDLAESPALRAADRPLIRAAQVLHFVLGCEHPAEYDAAVVDLATCSERLSLRRGDAVTWHVREMMRSAEMRLAEIGSLKMIPTACDPDGLNDWPSFSC